ncbi:hypothetical protein ACFQ3Z_17755 [Streptomyces nogalater]
MRDLPVRRLASTVLCASVLVGVTGPAAVAADMAREHGRTATQVSVPAAQKERLLARARALGSVNPALDPVVELLHQSLEKGSFPSTRPQGWGRRRRRPSPEWPPAGHRSRR